MRLSAPAPAEQKPLVLSEVEPPEPGRHQIRLRVMSCGVCHTDLHIVEGDLDLPRLPTVPGHEIVGTVDRLGSGVTGYRLGERVGVPWLHATCGTCRFCASGRENLCESIRFTGVHADGGFQEYVVAEEGYAFPIPDRFSDDEAAPLLCAGVVGYRTLRMSGIKPGQRLGIYGFGASAHIILQIAHAWGCKVYVFTRGKAHREMALSMGAAWAGGAEDSLDHPMDASIIFAPAGTLVPIALRRLDHGGTLALGGIHMTEIPAMPYELLWHERRVVSVANSTRKDVTDFLRAAEEARVTTHVEPFALEEANEAILKVKAGEVRGAAVLRVS